MKDKKEENEAVKILSGATLRYVKREISLGEGKGKITMRVLQELRSGHGNKGEWVDVPDFDEESK